MDLAAVLETLNRLATQLDSALVYRDEVSKRDEESSAFATNVDKSVTALPARFQNSLREARN